MSADAIIARGLALVERGQLDDALGVLGEGAAAYPDHRGLAAVLALTLHDAGHRDAALATLLGVVLDDGGADLDAYRDLLGARHAALLEVASR
jgi:thioredoxin-like negative regulator of GroEL